MVGVLTPEQQNCSRQITKLEGGFGALNDPKVLLNLCFITTKKFEGVVKTYKAPAQYSVRLILYQGEGGKKLHVFIKN